MNKSRCIAGVALAGGRSSRMGQNKALMTYHGQTLLDHAIGLLQQAGIDDVFVSGSYEGYRCIPDRAEYAGPAAALRDILQELQDYDGVLVVPVDMPLLTAEILTRLTAQNGGAFYEDFPLPVFVSFCNETPFCHSEPPLGGGGKLREESNRFLGNPSPLAQDDKKRSNSVKTLLQELNVKAFPLADPSAFANINAPEDWDALF